MEEKEPRGCSRYQAYRLRVAQHETVLYRCREMLKGAKNRARKKNIEFSLVLEDILTLAKQPRCPISHRLLKWKILLTQIAQEMQTLIAQH